MGLLGIISRARYRERARAHNPDNAQIWDGPNANAAHPLASGVVIFPAQPGKVKVTGFVSTLNVPCAAWFIPADESTVYPASSASSTGSGSSYTWTFTWNNVPAIGQDALLRIQDQTENGDGCTSDFTIHVLGVLGDLTGGEID